VLIHPTLLPTPSSRNSKQTYTITAISQRRYKSNNSIGDGKPEMGVGSKPITLTDNRGNKQTLNDVVYVPEGSEQILSLMQLWCFAFTSPAKLKIPFRTAHSSLESQSTMYSTSGNQPLSSLIL